MHALWQTLLIGLARSPRVKNFVQEHRSTSVIARRYVAGSNVEDLTALAAELAGGGIGASAFYLGEYIDTPELVGINVAAKLEVAHALGAAGLDVHLSVDPTQIGLQLGTHIARRNALQIAEQIARSSNNRPGVHCLMLDMEDAAVVDETIRIHNDLRDAGLPVALTVQAYLRRTQSDLQSQLVRGSHIRLVKGAFAMRGGEAFRTHFAIKQNYRELVRQMFSPAALEAGFYPSIATHDTSVHEFALELAEKNGWPRDRYEFEMLLGVRPEVARSLAHRGARIRLYMPFGEDWWPHAARRIGESPANGWLLLRSLLTTSGGMGASSQLSPA